MNNVEIPKFVNGDAVAFIGDSITHAGMYHADLLLFYATRFPDREWSVINCGIAGDTATDVLKRYDEDIAGKPFTVATVMLGMNDVGRDHYGPDKTSPEHLAARDKALRLYRESMTTLAERLQSVGCRVIFMTPTIYDQTAQIECENALGVNDALGQCAEFVKELADRVGSPVVDFRSIMNNVNARLQAEDPSVTIVGPDRTHPGEPGHLVMAYQFLRAQGLPQTVSHIQIDAASGCVFEETNCRVELESLTSDAVRFQCLENSLPFPVGDEDRIALEWVPFQQELNCQILQVNHLAKGTYTLRIDGERIGTWSAAQFAEGINLSEQTTTPQYRQAMTVRALNRKRHEIGIRLRTVPEVRFRYLAGVDVVPEAEEPLKQILDEVIEKEKGQPWYEHMKEKGKLYLDIRHQVGELEQQMKDLSAEMFRAAPPVSHQWSIEKCAE